MSVQEERFTAIANAIREKDSTTAPISANDFAARILAIKAGSDFAVPLAVSTSAGASIAAVNGNITVNGTAGTDGTATLILTAPGTWAVTASLNGKENTVNVEVTGSYNVAISINPSRLPDGYVEVEYILSDPACGINTDYMMKFNTSRLVMDIEPGSFNTAGGAITEYVFRTATSKISTKNYMINLWRSGPTDWRYRIGYTTSIASFVLDATGKRIIIDCDCMQHKLIVDGVVHTIPNDSQTMTVPLYLFNNAGSGGTVGSAMAKLYSAQIYNSGILVRDFVPCINPSGAVGLYDLVGKKFYGNTLSGSFTAGPAV